MIFVLELPPATEPRVWFAFDGDDLQRKLDAVIAMAAAPTRGLIPGMPAISPESMLPLMSIASNQRRPVVRSVPT